MSLTGWGRRHVAAILAVLGLLVIAGLTASVGLPAAIFPSVTFPIVKVIADAGEAPAAQMMPTVTRPLEEGILRVPGVTTVRSITARGSTEISADFAWGTDMQVALQRVQAETDRIRPDLPSGTRIDVEWMNTAIFPIQGYALTSRTRTQAELRDLAEFTLKPALIRIPGVSEVQIQGGRRREFQVWLDARQLEGRRLATADVIAAVRASHIVLSAGLAEQNHELYLTLVDGRVQDLDALAHLSVPVPGAPPATLADLGEVRVADEVSYVRTTAEGAPAVLVNLIRQPSANTVAIAQGVRETFRRQPDLLPRDVRWTTFYDQAQLVTDSVHATRDAIVIGVGLAALVLLVFLRNVRLTIIAVGAVPLTVAVLGFALRIAGQTINLMTLAGVAAAIGLIADDVIVVTEQLARGDGSTLQTLLPALIGSSLSTTVILLPFALLPGVVGAFFRPLALTLALALIVSFVIAALVVPVTIEFLGRGLAHPAHSGPRYERVVANCIQRGRAAVLATGLAIVVMLLLYRTIGTDFLPAMDEGAIILDYWTPPGTSLTDTDNMLTEVERIILAVPDVASYSRRTGTQLGFFITEPNRGDYVINLKPRGKRRDLDVVIDDLRNRVQGAEPAIHADFGQLLEDNIGDLTGGVPQPIDIKVFGMDAGLLATKAREIAHTIAQVPGVEDVFDGIVIAGPALEIRGAPLALSRYGLTTTDLHTAVEPALTGTVVGQVNRGEREYDLRVFVRHTGSLGDLRVRATNTPTGAIPLSTLATISTGPPEAEIDRENLQTFVGVTARLSGRSLGAAMAEIRGRIGRDVRLAPGMFIEYGGQFEQQQKSFRSLFLVLLSGLVLVALIVLFEFGDWRASLVTSVCAVASLTGVLLALLITGTTLNISSYVGAIMMVGIVGENAIFVIHEGRLELAAGTPVDLAWRNASRKRFRPVAMTVLATAFALAPLALDLGHGSQLMQPLAIGVIGGFVLSGPLVLLVLPALYALLDPHGRLGGSHEARGDSK